MEKVKVYLEYYRSKTISWLVHRLLWMLSQEGREIYYRSVLDAFQELVEERQREQEIIDGK